ncbi:hypothetical protein [Bradyrhizobium sp. LB11.1]|jgi:hypothetical protein|uniref:hypothetical protein n=1 Tax=Bradyrhizobium sp. LB11.1 TaxID=3156326 RepID=UPI0033982B2C
MIWKNFVNLPAIAPRRRVVATTILYGLSLAVRFTSATGEEVELPVQSAQRINPVMSIMVMDKIRLPYADWDPNPVQPIFVRQRWPLRLSTASSCSPP